MPKAKTSVSPEYGNESISQLQGPDRVRLRPGVIFGSDGLDGCEHAVFEILTIWTAASRLRISDAVVPWTGTRANSAGTGSLSSASFMPAVNTTTTMRAATMALPSA